MPSLLPQHWLYCHPNISPDNFVLADSDRYGTVWTPLVIWPAGRHGFSPPADQLTQRSVTGLVRQSVGKSVFPADGPTRKEAGMHSDQKLEVRVHIRWMIRRDMPEVLAIEGENFEFPWLEDDFIRCLRQRNCTGMVAEHDDRVVAFMVYELGNTRLDVLNFAVAANCRRRSIGRQMVARLMSKLSSQRRNRIVFDVRELNLPAQLFLRDGCGFRAVAVLRDRWSNGEDAYRMVFQYHQNTKGQNWCSTRSGESVDTVMRP